MKEWLHIVTSAWEKDHFSFKGNYYQVTDNVLQPKPAVKPAIYAGGESEAGKNLIAQVCSGYVMHGDSPEVIGARISDMKERREKLGLPPMTYGVAAYAIVRNTEAEVKKELERITNVQASSAGYNKD